MIPKLKLRYWLLVFVGLVALLIFLVFRFVVIGKSIDQIDREWQASAGFDPLEVYPPRDANEAALRLEALAATIGIELAPKDDSNRVYPSVEAASTIAEVNEKTRDHLRGLLTPSPILVAPSEELAGWLTVSSEVLSQVVELLESEEPRWDRHVEEGIDQQLPNLLGHLQLHRSLLLATAESARLGKGSDETEKWLTAVRALESSIESEPLLLQRLVAMAERTELLALLRALNPVPDGWEDSVDSQPWRAFVQKSLRLEGWLMLQSLRNGSLERLMSIEGVPARLMRTAAHAGARQHVESVEHTIGRFEREDPREFNFDQFSEEEMARIPRWNLISRLFYPNFIDAPITAARHELDMNLTARVLELRTLIAACESKPVVIRSEVPTPVRGINWLYQKGDKEIAIQASDDLSTASDHPLPLEFHLPIPSGCSVAVNSETVN